MEQIALESFRVVPLRSRPRLTSKAVAFCGLGAMAVPTFISVARDHWATEYGVHGPIILATGIWLLWRERKVVLTERNESGGLAGIIPLFLFSLLWLFARTFDILSAESFAIYMISLTIAAIYLGWRVLQKIWFPLFYLAFLIVPPGSIIDQLTQPLKVWISTTAVDALRIAGYPVANTGAIIQVGQYQLLVADACAGLMSLMSLTAIGLFYNHLSSGNDLKRAAVLVTAIVPIAVLANLVRVVVLILLTYYSGSRVAQGFVHDMAGLFTFSVSLAGMFVADTVYSKLFAEAKGL